MLQRLLFATTFVVCILCLFSCQKNRSEAKHDQVYNTVYQEVRLGDGVPLDLTIALRWQISDANTFYQQYVSADSFSRSILYPRTLELVKSTSNDFTSVDSVFSAQRPDYIATIKRSLLSELNEDGVVVKEVILSDIHFPDSYTKAMEQVGLQRQEIERIRQQNIVDLERATANKKKANADGEVKITEAQAEGELQKIKAKTEQSRRKNEVARAETQAQIARRQAEAEVERERLLAKAEATKQAALKSVEAQHKRELMQVDVDKQRRLDQVDFEKQIELAKMCAENPAFASFLINKELAGKVEIAVLPTGSDPNVFGNILNNRMKQD